MIGRAGGAIGAITAIVDRSILPSKAVKVDSATFWALLQLHLSSEWDLDQTNETAHRY